MIQGQFQKHFHSSLINNFKNIKKYETSQYESSHSAWYETEYQFSFEVFDNFSKFYVSVEDLAVRRMHVDPDRLLFMFDERIPIFLKSDSFLPNVNQNTKNGGESIEKDRNSALYDRSSGVSTVLPALQLDTVEHKFLTGGYNIIPRTFLVTGYKTWLWKLSSVGGA